jgi:hypothetical protein
LGAIAALFVIALNVALGWLTKNLAWFIITLLVSAGGFALLVASADAYCELRFRRERGCLIILAFVTLLVSAIWLGVQHL